MLWSTKVTWEVNLVLPIHLPATNRHSFFILLHLLCSVLRGTGLREGKASVQGPSSCIMFVPCRERRQQQKQKVHCHYSLFQGQQQNDLLMFSSAASTASESPRETVVPGQRPMHLNHGGLGQQVPALQSWQLGGGGCSQTNREPLCSQLQHVPWQIMVRSLPMPLGQDIQQGAAEQPSSQMQQLWNEGSTKVNCWDQECGSRKWF